MLDLDSHYQNILSELKKGHRGLVRFNSEEIQELNTLICDPTISNEKLTKVLCLVEFSAALHGEFEAGLINLLENSKDTGIIIHALNSSQKHIIEARFQKGNRLEFNFLETLKKLLYHSNPEVVEWVLRLIEACGSQGVYFLREFDKIKPSPWKLFNAHNRAILEIITLLQRRWRP